MKIFVGCQFRVRDLMAAVAIAACLALCLTASCDEPELILALVIAALVVVVPLDLAIEGNRRDFVGWKSPPGFDELKPQADGASTQGRKTRKN